MSCLVVSAAGSLGYFMRAWIGEVHNDVTAVGGALDAIADKLAAHSDRLARLEGWRDAMGGQPGGRRATDPPTIELPPAPDRP